jgi:hypothetical protein
VPERTVPRSTGGARHQLIVPRRADQPADPRRPRWGRRIGLAVVLATAIGVTPSVVERAEAGVTVSVDFDRPLLDVPRDHIGFTATTFDVDGGTVPDDPADTATLARLGAGAVRIHLRATPDGGVVSGAAGGQESVSADTWLRTYTGMGLAPTVVLDLDRSGALAVLRYLREHDHPVHRFVLGNEMDANSAADVSPAEYVRRFREIATAMRAVDPTLQIGGPAPAHFEGLSDELVRGLLRGPARSRASFIDFHGYGAGRGEQATMDSSWRYGEQLDRLRELVDDPSVGLQVGEFNLNWADEPQNNTQTQAVWVAAALGTILSRGAVAFQYGDKNQAMGLVADGRPKPSYRGMAAFTGGGVFRPFGATMVQAESSFPAVRVFASVDGINIVIVNTGPATPCRLRLDGFDGGRARVWQDEGGGFRELGQLEVDSRADVALPPLSVTTMVFDDAPQK